MRYRLICILGIFGFCFRACASDVKFTISAAEAANVKARLAAYDAGTLSLDQLLYTNAPETCRQIIGYYLENTNVITAKEKLPISRCYVACKDFQCALPLAQQYVYAYPNDFHGWDLLAFCDIGVTNDDRAIDAYEMAVALGDNRAYQPLAGEAIKGHRLEIIPKILPRLMSLQQAPETSMDDRINLTTILLAYSLITDQKGLFVKTLEGQNIKELLKDDTVRKNITSGCDMFSGKDIDKIRLELDAR